MSTTSTASTAQSLSGIVLPADSEKPARRLDAHDPQEVHALVGGQLETIACPAHRDLRAFIDAHGLAAGHLVNDRATRVFCPSHQFRNWIAGDVVIVGFDTALRELCDLSTAQEERITGLGPIHYPDREDRREKGRSYTWDVEISEDRMVSTSLSIGYFATPGAFGRLDARLVRNVVTPDSGPQDTVEGDWCDPFYVDTVGGFTVKRLDEFAEHALDVLRARFLLSDREVHAAFRAQP
jgi:hypothetical protein